ncbi:MAG: HAMP domain-containing histidine kinase [Ruminococcus sp.]|nr:HAMP domain-containing histidine kinase [Ruminococcus sp.]
MGIKLKKSDKKTSLIWKKIFVRPLRFAALVLACVFAGISITSYKYAESIGIDDFEPDYLISDEYSRQKTEMYEQLCVLSACYLSNVDNEWNFVGEKNLLSDFLYYMDYNNYKYMKTDNGILPVSSMFDYYVSYDNGGSEVRYVTNIGNSHTLENMSEDERIEYFKKNYSSYLLRRNGVVTSDIASSGNIRYYQYINAETGFYGGYYGDYNDYYYGFEPYEETYPREFVPIGSWYYDNYGRYFYCFGNEEPIRFFIYPKNTEKGRIAREGLVNVLTNENTGREISNEWDGILNVDEVPEDEEGKETNTVVYEVFLEETERYEATPGDDAPITVFISPKADVLEAAAASYKSIVSVYKNTKLLFIVSIVLMALCAVYLLASCGFEEVTEEGIRWSKPAFFGKRSVLLYCTVGLFYLQLCGTLLFRYYNDITYYVNSLLSGKYVGYIFFGLLCSVLSFPVFFIAMQLAEKVKTRTIKDGLLTLRIFRKIKNVYLNSELYANYQKQSMGDKLKHRSLKVIGVCVFVGLSFFFSIAVGNDVEIFFVCAILGFIAVMYLEIKNILSYRDLSKISRQIKLIGTDEPFEEKISERSAVYNDSLTLTQISEKVKKSVEEQIKSERMKIELVANVSHDLKTPLTSIIGYVDLLKKLELDDEASSYVQILDKKAQKLKGIVSDVFSLAKATSGIEVNLAKLDFVMLFNQAFADADDKIKASGKIIKTDIYEPTAMVMADGDKMYRVFQNLLDNALNYSLEGSRIFLEIRKSGDSIKFITKNISSSPIDFTAEEIVERFVRGDKSRTDGGNGLGLSIAKSFTEACGGEFEIRLDGDMFKTIVSLPIYKEEQEDKEKQVETDIQAVISDS